MTFSCFPLPAPPPNSGHSLELIRNFHREFRITRLSEKDSWIWLMHLGHVFAYFHSVFVMKLYTKTMATCSHETWLFTAGFLNLTDASWKYVCTCSLCFHCEALHENHAYMHICICAYVHICIYAYMHISICAQMHICIYACMHLFIYAYMNLHMWFSIISCNYTYLCTLIYNYTIIYIRLHILVYNYV